MSWAVGYDTTWRRDIGYGVPAICDHPGCGHAIDRGLAYVCGGQPYGGDVGCGLYFCREHLIIGVEEVAGAQICERCRDENPPFEPTPDSPAWIEWKLTDDSWAPWRAENPELVAAISEGRR